MKFKSTIAALAIAFASTLAMATDVGVAWENGRADTNGRNSTYNQIEFTAAQPIGTTGFGVLGSFASIDNSSKSDTSMEAKIGGTYTFVPGLFVKGGLGAAFGSSTAKDFNFYTVGAGASIPFQAVRFTGEYERSEAFNSRDPSWNTYKAGVEYDFIKNHTVALRYVTRTSGVRTEGGEVAYNIAF